ncbi:MAG TPA: molecular chaperone DnaK, partial [Clostridiaceae bacterium]|nr:molecular chaperone DnaK [Clostridiaceae bacterium]
MEKNKLKYFEQKLINEKNEIIDTIDSVKESVRLNSSGSEGGEISMVDNHPA